MNQTVCITNDANSADFFNTNFSASKNSDGSWTVDSDNWSEVIVEQGDDDTSLVVKFFHRVELKTIVSDNRKAYDIQWRTNTSQSSWATECYNISFGTDIGWTAINITITDLEPGTSYLLRFRDTNLTYCIYRLIEKDKTPDAWSTIVEGTTSENAP